MATTITVDRMAGITEGLAQLPDALGRLRQRVLELAAGLGADEWAGPSRCHRWSAHDVIRHVRDGCRLHVSGLRHDPSWPFDKPFDNRATPDEWLSLSAGETPDQTVADLRRWSADEGPALFERLKAADQDVVSGPYGPIPWTILSLHVLWDAWLHERDVSQVTGIASPSSPVEDAAVATYALFIASMPAVLQNVPLDVTVALRDNGRHYGASVQPGHVELSSSDVPAAADLHGELDSVVDSLAGRGPLLGGVLSGVQEKREPLTWLRAVLVPEAGP